MTSRIRSKGITGVIALALALLPVIAYSTPVFAALGPCNLSGGIGGFVVYRPPTPDGPWSFTVSGSTPIASTPALVKGAVMGSFSSPNTGTSAVNGGWMFRINDGAIFIKLVGVGFSVDIAILSLPPVGFTFAGNLFVQGIPQPIALVSTSNSLTCS